MAELCFDNARYFGSDGQFHRGGFRVEDDRIAAVGEACGGEDLGGAYVLPGLVDVHTHGCSGFDFSTSTVEELAVMAKTHARLGVAGFLATSMTLPEDRLAAAFAGAAQLRENPPEGAAQLLGINMEGPYFAEKRKGAQNAAYLRLPDEGLYRRLQEAAKGCIRMVDIAPELPGALELIAALRGEVVLSLAHSEADYDKAAEGFAAGVRHVTHLFNAMAGLHHRLPGPIAAAFEARDATAELVCDGVHLHPAIVRLCFALFGAERICLVSDSMEACGMPDGSYELGGQTVTVEGPRATLADGTIAGSVTPVLKGLQNLLRWGIPPEAAVCAASLTPARRLGVEAEYGAIAEGCRASFLVTDESFTPTAVYCNGSRL